MWTNDFIRIQFADHGRARDGADCWGLACIIFKEKLGIELPLMMTGYDDCKDKLKISELIKSHSVGWDSINRGEEKPFDLAVFKIMGQPMHVAVVVEPGLMIHCERGSGVYLSKYYREDQWERRLQGFYRYADRTSLTAALPPTPADA